MLKRQHASTLQQWRVGGGVSKHQLLLEFRGTKWQLIGKYHVYHFAPLLTHRGLSLPVLASFTYHFPVKIPFQSHFCQLPSPFPLIFLLLLTPKLYNAQWFDANNFLCAYGDKRTESQILDVKATTAYVLDIAQPQLLAVIITLWPLLPPPLSQCWLLPVLPWVIRTVILHFGPFLTSIFLRSNKELRKCLRCRARLPHEIWIVLSYESDVVLTS